LLTPHDDDDVKTTTMTQCLQASLYVYKATLDLASAATSSYSDIMLQLLCNQILISS